MSLLDQPLCSFSSSALPLEPMLVVEWRGEEAISRPYRFEVKLASLNPLLDDEAMLGQPATLSLTDAKGKAQPYHGIITEAELLDGDSQYFYFRVVLEPRMALLRQSRFSEIWLNKSLPDLIRAVLAEAALNSEGPGTSGAEADSYDFDIRLAQGDLALNESNFTCQFEETSFAFLSRLLEYYGVYYFFEQQDGHEALVFCGDQRYQPKSETLLNYRPLDTALDAGQGIALTRTFNRRLASQPKDVVVQDFSATNAQMQLLDSASIASASIAVDADSEQSQAAANAPGFNGEQWLYGEHFGTNKEGQELAKLRAQALGCRHREFHGKGRAVGLRAGYPMRLLGHLRLTLNTQYQVIQVQHDGSQPLPGLGQDQAGTAGDINTRFIAIPGDVQFRPQRLTRKPRVQGLLSAIVDGDDTGQPLLNQNGCYKVIFPFIRGDKGATRGSAWLRMATMSSGANHGMHFPLLKGTEVLVSFLGGDPDRPVITGSVPNSENPNKVNEKNAMQSGLSTAGGHYLAMEDSPSGPLMQMGAPVGSTMFSLGQGEISGAQLQTQNHMQFSSTSYQHEVPGLYKKTIGSAAAASATESTSEPEKKDEKKPEEKSESKSEDKAEETPEEKIKKLEEENEEEKPKYPHTKELNEWWGKGGASAPLISAEGTASALMVEQNLAGEQWEGSAGIIKQFVETFAQFTEINASLLAYNVEIGPHSDKEIWGHKEEKALHEFTALAQRMVLGAQTITSTQSTHTTGTFIVDATAGITLKVGACEIAINAAGVTVTANTPAGLVVNGPLQVNGDLTVGAAFATTLGALTAESVSSTTTVGATDITATTLTSATCTLGGMPFDPATGIAALAAANTRLDAAVAAQEAASAALNTVADGVSEVTVSLINAGLIELA